MDIIVCLDDKDGMGFNMRRQSRDRVLIQHMLQFIEGKPLWVAPGSAALFDPLPGNVHVGENYLLQAGAGEYCFVEDRKWEEFAHKVKRIIVYRWNRSYPADIRFPEAERKRRMLVSSTDFSGSSHDRLTQEVYSI